jgi:hypothetical protein
VSFGERRQKISAKPLFIGSIPIAASNSNFNNITTLVAPAAFPVE